MIDARQLHIRYGQEEIVKGVQLRLAPGETLALLGPNGCGKTTLLKALCAIHAPHAGSVQVDGQDLFTLSAPERARRIAYVPQQHRLVFAYSVIDVVMMGRLASRGLIARPTADDFAAVHAILHRLGLQALATRSYAALSGGQRQQVLIARALAQDAPYLLLDEPASSLDFGNQLRLLELLAQLRDDGRAVLFTTHHPDHAFVVASRVILMQAGRFIAQGSPAQCIDREQLARLYGLAPDQLQRTRLAPHWSTHGAMG
ncbi:MAG: ABC transporter [Thiomonas sp. 14-64-326]|jgi:iron complex transport system ATP-binding protein|uniref:ABC transporter ATP-binding protein n=1 Tax=Thiomonas sp. TaxID=2047785 RepID=UPI000BC90C82|nr:ABC transporter ATP-binding protein [Thiomonas sp.]OZB72253.1 MAG: ABC transporter [Thiomonas sp. 14-64-326]